MGPGCIPAVACSPLCRWLWAHSRAAFRRSAAAQGAGLRPAGRQGSEPGVEEGVLAAEPPRRLLVQHPQEEVGGAVRQRPEDLQLPGLLGAHARQGLQRQRRRREAVRRAVLVLRQGGRGRHGELRRQRPACGGGRSCGSVGPGRGEEAANGQEPAQGPLGVKVRGGGVQQAPEPQGRGLQLRHRLQNVMAEGLGDQLRQEAVLQLPCLEWYPSRVLKLKDDMVEGIGADDAPEPAERLRAQGIHARRQPPGPLQVHGPLGQGQEHAPPLTQRPRGQLPLFDGLVRALDHAGRPSIKQETFRRFFRTHLPPGTHSIHCLEVQPRAPQWWVADKWLAAPAAVYQL
mmetsp:Transcript_73679/g.216198  ORF Transcript_73679/g.216198 Transcript_73679/m.216198 type:complete len:344 (+) Transcript_73679:129-1160(+)